MSCSHAQDITARKCDRTLFEVRPGFRACRAVASSWTQSKKSRISFRPSCSIGTAPPHRDHLRRVVAYSSRVRCAGLPERRYFVTIDSSVVGIVDLQRRRRPLPCPIRSDQVALCCASCRVEVAWPDLDGPRPKVIGRNGGCTEETAIKRSRLRPDG